MLYSAAVRGWVHVVTQAESAGLLEPVSATSYWDMTDEMDGDSPGIILPLLPLFSSSFPLAFFSFLPDYLFS
jgi:hypothetical protein